MSENELFSFLAQLESVNVMKTGEYDALHRLQEYFLKEDVSRQDLTNMLFLLKCGLQFRDCGVFEELKNVYKLLPQIREDTAALTCEIFYTILKMDKSTNFEHWLHTILSNVAEEHESWLVIRICDSILGTLIENSQTMTVEKTHVQKILLNGCEDFLKHFLGITVPKLIKVDREVLRTVLEHIKLQKDNQKHYALNMLSYISDLYLSEDGKESQLAENDICDIIEKGLTSPGDSHRKTAMNLAKKAVRSFITDCSSQTGNQHWQSYFLLLQSLENEDVSCLQAFEMLQPSIDKKWLNIAYDIGMNHKNIKVKHQCIDHRLQTSIDSTDEAKYLLLALNDTELYTKPDEIVAKLSAALKTDRSFLNILVAIPTIPWAPVSLYYITSTLITELTDDFIYENKAAIIQALKEITKLHHTNKGNNNNNAAVTQHVHAVVITLVTKMCKHFHWRDVFDVLTKTEINVEDENYIKLVPGLVNLQIDENEKHQFYEFVMNSTDCLRPMISYFSLTKQEEILLDLIKRKIEKFSVACSNHEAVILDLVYIKLLCDAAYELHLVIEIWKLIDVEMKVILQFFIELLSTTSNLSYCDEPNVMKEAAGLLITLTVQDLSEECQEILLKIYATAMSVLTNEGNNDMKQKVLSSYLLTHLIDTSMIRTNRENDLKSLLKMNLATEIDQNSSDELLADIFNLALGEIMFMFSETEIEMNDLVFEDFVQFTHHNLFKKRKLNFWVVRVVAMNLDRLKSAGFDILKYIRRIWMIITDFKEIDEMQSGISEFTELIMHDAIIEDPRYNDVLKFYFVKFKELARGGDFNALYRLACTLKEKNICSKNEQLIDILQELMMYTQFMGENERLIKEVEIKVEEEKTYSISGTFQASIDDIHYHTVNTLLKIDDIEVHRKILIYIMTTIDETLRNEDRYQDNSQEHRIVQIGVQHILFYALIQNSLTVETFDWCMKFLQEKQHLPSVRICLEWFIALDIVVKDKRLDSDLGNMLSTLPVISQEMIMFMALSHKMHDLNYGIIERPNRFPYTWEEYNFVMQFLLKRTMLPSYRLRVYSQILAAKIYRSGTVHPDLQKYPMIIVESTLKECKNEEAYSKLDKHFFTNNFDIICHLVPKFIYKILPRYFGMQVSGFSYPLLTTSALEEYLARNESEFLEKWKEEYYNDDDIEKLRGMQPVGNKDI